MHAIRRCERVWWRTVRREWRRTLGVYPPRCVHRHRAARTEIARLRYGRPRRTERRRRATETHFTHPWVRTGGPVVQGYHLNYTDANDSGRRRRRVVPTTRSARTQFLRRKTGNAKP